MNTAVRRDAKTLSPLPGSVFMGPGFRRDDSHLHDPPFAYWLTQSR